MAGRRARATGSLWLAMAAACSGQGTGPTDSTELASTLDNLTVEANREGDVDASAAFSSAAIALRLGVEPTPIAMQVGGTRLQYLGFVVDVPVAGQNGASERLRTVVAVDRAERPEHVLYLATLADSADLGRPSMSLDQRRAASELAWAGWRDLASGDLWVATAGRAGVVVTSSGGSCPGVRPEGPTQCQSARFGAFLRGDLQRLAADRSQVLDDRQALAFEAFDVSGALLTFPAP